MADQLPPGVREVARIPAPGGGTWVLGDDGGVFALDGAPFMGAYTTLPDDQRYGDRQGWKGIEARPNGGYSLISGRDEYYDFGPAGPRANPLYTDPSFNAFIRSSGLSLETWAADAARKKAAIDAALGTTVEDVKTQGVRQRQGIDDSYEARGVYRSGQRLESRAMQEGDELKRISDLQTGTAEQKASIGSLLAQQVAGLQQKNAELGYGTAGEQALKSGEEDLRKRYPEAYV